MTAPFTVTRVGKRSVKLTVLYDDIGTKWISQKFNNGDFDYWLVLRIEDLYECMGESEAPAHYSAEILVVSPDEAGTEKVQSALRCIGLEDVDLDKFTPEHKVDALVTYGVHAPVWGKTGNNRRKLVREMRNQAEGVTSLFGFYMDTPVNRIGSTGWDFVKGNVIAGLTRHSA